MSTKIRICSVCGCHVATRKDGNIRHHLGTKYDGRWRQMCEGTHKPPAQS